MDAPTQINELAQRILRNEPVSDEELAAAVDAMRTARTGVVEKNKAKEKAEEVDLGALFNDLPDKKET